MILVFVLLLCWKVRGFKGSILTVIVEEPLVLTPVIMLLLMLFCFKPINNYLSFRQSFIFDKDKIKIKKYFKSYLSYNNDFEFNISEIVKIFDIQDDGITLYLGTMTQVTIPFVSGDEKSMLLKKINPDGKIEIQKK